MVGGLILVIFLSAAAGVGIVSYRGYALDAESRTFVDSAVTAISSKWSTAQLLDRADPELRARVKPERLRALFDNLANQLGPMTLYQGASGDALLSYDGAAGGVARAAYIARAKFKVGVATFTLLLVKRDGRWMIRGFRVQAVPSAAATRAT